ncbi:PDZ domain-containing protein [Mucilaginibacter sp. SP1R1]|uniref:PDZ domain-containing protein n=1 Tax=Mucilaginibacter sp. SP1R1 TaxID=2723091 RepID=UPI001800851B|nr:PDZ domain-containing protein [Mucilaginibacter sp. SP1R1]MBB6148379.1 hypothetical protein [Mucilaginibacter sp. SP1R1]
MQAHVEGDYIFDQLFVNGQLQRMARYPNYNPAAKMLGGTAADAISAQRAARWGNPVGGYVHALHRSEWGGFSYIITGKNANGELQLEGGWQNNRKMGMHPSYRFVENIFEELDTVNEWYYNKTSKILYFYPPKGLNLNKAKIEIPQLKHLFEFRGSEKSPVTNISIEGLELTQTLRTFMDNKEPLLRSDWTTYRGGAVLFEGAVNCSLKNCFLNTVGGNAVYFSNYNRKDEVSGCRIWKAGGSGVSFVGDPNAVRSPSFEYNEFVPFNQIDRTPGPKTNNFPALCTVYDNLIEEIGQTEIQSAGVQISMSQDITISHNTIDNLPRAGINISEGTWGGHIIEYNDVFNTVNESGDHGSFNSWGRDRYWHPVKSTLDTIVEKHPDLVLLDVVHPIIMRNNRFRCDHGWDVDLDDGSSNYRIYNNLMLNGGLKFREGYNRVAENNIMINNTFHPHVWFKNSQDVFRNNVIFRNYAAIGMPKNDHWGKEIDYNIFMDQAALTKAQTGGRDAHSVYAEPLFIDPAKGDFRLKNGSAAFATGFKNFDMNNFGVVSAGLKAVAQKIVLPQIKMNTGTSADSIIEYMGLKLKNLNTLGERSATGMASETGILILQVMPDSPLKGYIKVNDVLLMFNGKSTAGLGDLQANRLSETYKGTLELVLFRDQKELSISAVIK